MDEVADKALEGTIHRQLIHTLRRTHGGNFEPPSDTSC
jgi:hypothetical protein